MVLPPHPFMRLQRAFTLIELLVVITVIGILSGLLLPVLSRAKARAQMVTDVNNTKQILMAAHIYAGDAQDYLPRPGWQVPYACWAYGAPFPYSTGGTAADYSTAYPAQQAACATGQLFSYLTTSQILMCPGDRVNSLFYQRQMYISSYVWNGAISGYDVLTDKTFKLGQFNPGAILQWEADETIPTSLNDGADYPNEGFTRRHGGSPSADPTRNSGSMVTIGLIDGSAKRMSSMELYRLAGGLGFNGNGPPAGMPDLPNDLWCNPGSANGGPGGL
jgi:prepilin-type N-terminal cleavage/methylation domain-containing protein